MRGKGEGSLKKNPKTGLWESRIELPPQDGKRRRLVKRGKNKAALLAYHNAKLAELREHGDLPSSSPTVEAYLTRWLKEKAEHARPNTMTNYRSQVKAHIVPALGKKKLDRLSGTDVKALHKAVRSKGLSSTYALNAHRVLSTALSDAVAEGVLTSNPAKRVRAPKRSRPTLEAFTLEESIRLLDHIAHEPDGARWATALLTGARRGEVIGLERDRVGTHLDLSWQLQRVKWEHGCGGTCHVKRAGSCPQRVMTDVPEDYEYRHVRGGLYLTRPKSPDGWRIVPLVDPLKSILERHMARNPDSQFVFTRPDGECHDPRDDTAAWRDVLERSGIAKNVRLHDLRHTAVDLLLAAGVPPEVVQRIVGHSTVTQTLAYSSRANADPRILDAMRSMGALFSPPAETAGTLERAS